MANLRKIDCEHYSACLDRAAKQSGAFYCFGCDRYSRPEALEKGFEHELNGKKIGGTDNTLRLSVSARKDQEVEMETQAKYEATGKECTKCGVEKPLNDFSREANGKYGRRSICKKCDSAAAKKRNLKKRMLKNAKAADKSDQTIAPGSAVIKKVVEKAMIAKAAKALSVNRGEEGAPDSKLSAAEILAEEHWAYIRGLLVAHGVELGAYGEPELAKIEVLYKSAMIHGYKHGRESVISDRYSFAGP